MHNNENEDSSDNDFILVFFQQFFYKYMTCIVSSREITYRLFWGHEGICDNVLIFHMDDVDRRDNDKQMLLLY